jgi:hypothetical protein
LEKAQNFQKFPLSYRAGFIHSIPEDDFDVATATIIDVSFLGLLPKIILSTLYQYARDIKRTSGDSSVFEKLIDKLNTAFIYRPILIQKVIQLLITKQKKEMTEYLSKLDRMTHTNNSDDTPSNNDSQDEVAENQSQNQTSQNSRQQNPRHSNTLPLICHGDKCRLFRAKGIIRHPMYCMKRKNACSGCFNENLLHRKVKQMEQMLLEDFTDNGILMHLIDFIKAPISLKNFRNLFRYLPIFVHMTRNDHVYGASRYLANTLGFTISDEVNNNRIDKAATENKRKQLWRMASFRCQCNDLQENSIERFGHRSFCIRCSFLIFHDNPVCTVCPGCNINEAWQAVGKPCLSCMIAAIIYKNPFHKRFQQELEDWLADTESESSHSDTRENTRLAITSQLVRILAEKQLMRKRRANIEISFREIKEKAPAA